MDIVTDSEFYHKTLSDAISDNKVPIYHMESL